MVLSVLGLVVGSGGGLEDAVQVRRGFLVYDEEIGFPLEEGGDKVLRRFHHEMNIKNGFRKCRAQ